MKKIISLFVLCSGIAGCAIENTNAPMPRAPEALGPAPYMTQTPAELALQCIAAERRKGQDLRLGIGEITDGTGARTFADGMTTLLTQRPDMMFAVAVGKTGIRALNRNATRVAEWELAQSMEQRLGEGREVEIEGQTFQYRPVTAGSMLGSTHYVSGALTEANWNIYSNDKRTAFAGAYTSSSEYYISVAVDLMVTDTRTTEIVLSRSYTKQIVGREISKGLFRFFEIDNAGGLGPIELFDASAGQQQNEPVQRAVRWLVELAAYDIVSTLTKTKNTCDTVLAPPAPPVIASTNAAIPQPAATASSGAVVVAAAQNEIEEGRN